MDEPRGTPFEQGEGSEPVSREARMAARSARRNARVLIITAIAVILFLLMSRLGG